MRFQFIFLWSDILIWFLFIMGVVFFIYVLKSPALQSVFRRFLSHRSGMAAATILSIFIFIGVIDSIHYREALPTEKGRETQYAVDVLSLLDYLAKPLRTQTEKTYSAPLALRAYSMETIDSPNGIVREFPRLTYGGIHLGSAEEKHSQDIFFRTIRAIFLAFLSWVAVVFIAKCLFSPQEKTAHQQPDITAALKNILITLLFVFLLAFPIFFLAADYHVFGTDKVGQDVLYQILKSIRTALIIGLITTLVLLPLAVILGVVAGYFRGVVDDVVQYIYTVINSIPGVLLIAASLLMLQVIIDNHTSWFSTTAERADLRLLALCFILGMTSWTGLCRLLRGEALKIREMEYIQAAKALGVSQPRIIFKHILPNIMHIIIISIAMDFSGLVLAEAVLSYVGIGVDPATTSFGTMINNARMELGREPVVWWSLSAAFSTLFILVLSANLFADALRDVFDPRTATR